jgi:hypothetical protein
VIRELENETAHLREALGKAQSDGPQTGVVRPRPQPAID